MTVLKVSKVGENLAIVLTDEAQSLLGLAEGDLLLAQKAEGRITLQPATAEVAEQVELARKISSRYPDALNDLAREIMAKRRNVLKKLAE